MAIKYIEWLQHRLNTLKINQNLARPSKNYQNWDFWSENIPSGNPVPDYLHVKLSLEADAMIVPGSAVSFTLGYLSPASSTLESVL
jgi:hypothetical protein